MAIKEKLEHDLHEAMRANDTIKKNVIRMALSAIKLQEVETRKTLTDPEVVALLYKEIKMREETIADALKIDRQDIIAENNTELEILKGYLPKQLSETELQTLVDEAIQGTGARSVKEMGMVMKAVIERAQGSVSNAAISAAVKARLAALDNQP